MKRIETQVDLPAVPSVVWEQLVDTASMGSLEPLHHLPLRESSRSESGSRCASRPWAADR